MRGLPAVPGGARGLVGAALAVVPLLEELARGSALVAETAFAVPFPAFAPSRMGEDELGRRLAGAEKRRLTGRG